MAREDDDNRPRPPVRHEVGQDLSALSRHELDERVALLEAEIARLKAEKERKGGAKSLADSVFRV